MYDKVWFLTVIAGKEAILLSDARAKITPQADPTSPRIKELLSRGLMAPETLTPVEVRELAASVVYHLIMKRKE